MPIKWAPPLPHLPTAPLACTVAVRCRSTTKADLPFPRTVCTRARTSTWRAIHRAEQGTVCVGGGGAGDVGRGAEGDAQVISGHVPLPGSQTTASVISVGPQRLAL